jgi:hypothetical protein
MLGTSKAGGQTNMKWMQDYKLTDEDLYGETAINNIDLIPNSGDEQHE